MILEIVRFATGDLSAVLLAPSPCGRTDVRIKGWMGRAVRRMPAVARASSVDQGRFMEVLRSTAAALAPRCSGL